MNRQPPDPVQGEGAKTVLPARAGAKFSFRLVPDQDPEKIAAELKEMLQRLCPPGIEIELSQTHGAPGVVVSLESPSSRCEQLARQVTIFNRPIPVSEMISKIEAIDRDAVRAIAQRLTSGHPTLTAVGPAGQLPSSESFAERLN